VIALSDNLFVGYREDLVWMDDLRWAETPADAARIIIEEDNAALIPEEEGWEAMARQTLILLGADEDHIAWCFRWQRRVNERYRNESSSPDRG
jgi:hypothetical protein